MQAAGIEPGDLTNGQNKEQDTMKKTIGGKLYNTETMTTLASRSAYTNGNYAGKTEICKTTGGAYAVVTTSNGQDCYRSNNIEAIDKAAIAERIDGWELDDGETEALLAEGIITEA